MLSLSPLFFLGAKVEGKKRKSWDYTRKRVRNDQFYYLFALMLGKSKPLNHYRSQFLFPIQTNMKENIRNILRTNEIPITNHKGLKDRKAFKTLFYLKTFDYHFIH